jgi:hypothetical protein
MSEQIIAVLGIDLGKNSVSLAGLDPVTARSSSPPNCRLVSWQWRRAAAPTLWLGSWPARGTRSD